MPLLGFFAAGVWESWGRWSDCTLTCGGGKRQRTRSCDVAEDACLGTAQQEELCSDVPCPAAGA